MSGKLYIVGEYQVLSPKGAGILYAIDRYVYFKIEDSLNFSYITRNEKINFSYDNEKLSFAKDDYQLTNGAIKTVFNYLKYKNIKVTPFLLTINNDLENNQNQKYGFGSSSAVISGVIKIILLKFLKNVSDELIFKLAVLTQIHLNQLSSGGDLASTIYGGIIYYQRYNLKNILNKKDDISIVDQKWADFKVKKIDSKIKFSAIWTKKSYKTKSLTKKISEKEIKHARKIVDKTYLNLKNNEFLALKKRILKYQFWLDNILEKDFLITPEIKLALSIVKKYNLVAKISGAGGGDCLILLSPKNYGFEKIKKELEENNLELIFLWGKFMINTNRKDEHIKYALEEEDKSNDFDNINLEHDNLSCLNFSEIDLSTEFLGQKIKYPIYINAMTGGSENGKNINAKLAKYASKFEIPLVLGSQSAGLKDKALENTYKIVRKNNPNGFIVSNLSANASVNDVDLAVKMIKANAISIHLNMIQEIMMAEGDRNFSNWIENITKILKNVKIPLLIKEVGFGMSRKTLIKLKEIGIKYVDTSGKGGTNFSKIERKRKNSDDLTFENLGISTVESLKNAEGLNLKIYASGGIRNALDVFKALYLGADAVGLSKFFLNLSQKSDEEAFLKIEELISNLKKCFLIFGFKNIKALRK